MGNARHHADTYVNWYVRYVSRTRSLVCQPDTSAGTSSAFSGDASAVTSTGSCRFSRYVSRLFPLVRQLVRQFVWLVFAAWLEKM